MIIIGIWNTVRRPTAEDADHEGGVWNSEGQWVEWDEVLDTEPWMHTNRPKPYRTVATFNLPDDDGAKANGSEPYMKPTCASETIQCRDCKFCMENVGGPHTGYFDQCTYNSDTRFCDIERTPPRIMARLLGYCGAGARFFQPRRKS